MFRKLILTALIVAWSLSGAVSAADFTWVGDNSGSWNDPNNWDVLGVPSNPRTGYAGDNVFINEVFAPNYTCNVNTTGAVYMALYVGNNGVMDVTAGTDGTITGGVWGLAGNGSSYNNINDGTVNVSGSWTVAQNHYIGHTDTAGSYGVMNILPTGVVRTSGVLTIAGRRGNGELNIWGTYYLVGGARWDLLPRPEMLPYTSVVRIYDAGLWRWTGDHVSNTTDNWNNVPWLIANGHLVSGVLGYEVVYQYDATNNVTNMTLSKYLRAYSPVYSPALLNDGVNVNRVNLLTPTGTIDLSWTKPEQSGIGDSNAILSTVYFGTDNPPTSVLPGAGSILAASVTGVPIEKSQDYYWKVDSYDPNSAVTTPGDIWSFNTQNVAPVASAEATPVRIWLVAGTASTTLHGTATDDGYPLPTPPTLTYTWTQTDATKDILPDPGASTQDVALYFDTAFAATVTTIAPQTRNFQVVCNDGAATGPAYSIAVTVYANPCLAGQAATGVTVGDIYPPAVTTNGVTVVGDCMINFKDFAVFINGWNTCKTTDLICPF